MIQCDQSQGVNLTYKGWNINFTKDGDCHVLPCLIFQVVSQVNGHEVLGPPAVPVAFRFRARDPPSKPLLHIARKMRLEISGRYLYTGTSKFMLCQTLNNNNWLYQYSSQCHLQLQLSSHLHLDLLHGYLRMGLCSSHQ
jgi:hypothetical protein